ncbi:TPA: hypothetical protein DDZ86_04025 [Candidatus Dependentiae bacterium]|nr:MAG: hypothetical protein UW09_C0003G0156 [candidate division TM6 bacterium GW2011_GWF2_43_87]HBL98783.1 hypothetical protein [Candidatus Dependentiae bacterium]
MKWLKPKKLTWFLVACAGFFVTRTEAVSAQWLLENRKNVVSGVDIIEAEDFDNNIYQLHVQSQGDMECSIHASRNMLFLAQLFAEGETKAGGIYSTLLDKSSYEDYANLCVQNGMCKRNISGLCAFKCNFEFCDGKFLGIKGFVIPDEFFTKKLLPQNADQILRGGGQFYHYNLKGSQSQGCWGPGEYQKQGFDKVQLLMKNRETLTDSMQARRAALFVPGACNSADYLLDFKKKESGVMGVRFGWYSKMGHDVVVVVVKEKGVYNYFLADSKYNASLKSEAFPKGSSFLKGEYSENCKVALLDFKALLEVDGELEKAIIRAAVSNLVSLEKETKQLKPAERCEALKSEVEQVYACVKDVNYGENPWYISTYEALVEAIERDAWLLDTDL